MIIGQTIERSGNRIYVRPCYKGESWKEAIKAIRKFKLKGVPIKGAAYSTRSSKVMLVTYRKVTKVIQLKEKVK